MTIGRSQLLGMALLMIVIAGASGSVGAQSRTDGFFALPVELDGDYGAANGDALQLRFMPLWRTPNHEGLTLMHLSLITFADAPPLPGSSVNPNPLPGPSATGISDLLHMTLWEPHAQQGTFIWGVGAALGVPTASDDALGSGKWAAGPAARLVYRGKDWTIGATAGQRWSFAGDSDRADVSVLLVRGEIRRTLGSGWYFVSAPIINANWRASSGNRWLVPVGGGFGRAFRLNGHPWGLSLQAYYNAIRPEGAPDWSLRVSLLLNIPQFLTGRGD